MTHTVSNSAPVSSSHTVKQYAGFGIRGADIPTTGDSGGSPVLNDGILSTSEYYWEVETAPGSGTVTIYPDMTFEHDGAVDGSWTWVYRLYWVDADGTNGNATATVTDVFGTAAVVLAIANATHGHSADGIGLTTQWLLSVAEASHAQAADNLGLSTTGSASLSVADGTHAHSAETLTLATQQLLAIADALHAHAADNEALDTSNAVWLTVQEALHNHASDSLGLSLQTWLAVADAVQAHFADAAVLSVPTGGFTGSLSDEDIARIVVQVMAALNATTIPVDMIKVKGQAINGSGSEADPWGP